MQNGKIKWFSSEKGYGFIKPRNGGEDVFLHANNIVGHQMGDTLRDGQEIEFETERTDKGLSAINASPISPTTGGMI